MHLFLRRVILATPFGGIICTKSTSCRLPLAPLSKEGAMTERDLTEREDRLVIFWLTAMAIVLIFVLILSSQ
jgi:hypothetical protein